MKQENAAINSQQQIYMAGLQENVKSANLIHLYNLGSAALPQILKNYYEMYEELHKLDPSGIKAQDYSIIDTSAQSKAILTLKAEKNRVVAEVTDPENKTLRKLASYDKDGFKALTPLDYSLGALTVPEIKEDIQNFLTGFKGSFPGSLYYNALETDKPYHTNILIHKGLTPVIISCSLTRTGDQKAFLVDADKLAKDQMKALFDHDPVMKSNGQLSPSWSQDELSDFLREVVSKNMSTEDIILATMTEENGTSVLFDTKTGGLLSAYPDVETQLAERGEHVSIKQLEQIKAEVFAEKISMAERLHQTAYIVYNKERTHDLNAKTDIHKFQFETHIVTGTTLDEHGRLRKSQTVKGPSLELDLNDPKSIDKVSQKIAEQLHPTITLESCSVPLMFTVGAGKNAPSLTYKMKPSVITLLVCAVRDGIAKFIEMLKQALAKLLYKISDLLGIRTEHEVMQEFAKASDDTIKGLNLVSMVVMQEKIVDEKQQAPIDRKKIAARVKEISSKAGFNIFENTVYTRLTIPIRDTAVKYNRSVSLYISNPDTEAKNDGSRSDPYAAKLTCQKDGTWVLSEKERTRELGRSDNPFEKGPSELKSTIADLVTKHMIAELIQEKETHLDKKDGSLKLGAKNTIASVEIGGLNGKLLEAANKLTKKTSAKSTPVIDDDFGVK